MSELSFYEADRGEDEAGRLRRLEELEGLFPIPETGFAIGGGLETGLAFAEARRAYVEGLWLCTVFSATAAIERHIAAGDNSVVGLDTLSLLEKGASSGRLDSFETAKYAELAKVRDGYARFREPIMMIEQLVEAGERGLGANEILEDDARMALSLASAYFQKNCAL